MADKTNGEIDTSLLKKLFELGIAAANKVKSDEPELELPDEEEDDDE